MECSSRNPTAEAGGRSAPGVCILIYLLALLILSLLSACSNPTAPVIAVTPTQTPPLELPTTPEAAEISIPTQAALFTATPAPFEAAATPTILPAGNPLQPLVTAPAVRFGSWSLEGDWFAFWLSSEEDIASDFYPAPPARLAFYNLRTEQECDYPEFISQNPEDPVVWQSGAEVVFKIEDRWYAGTPCGSGFVQAQAPDSLTGAPDPALSPDGAYRVETTETENAAGILSLDTRVLSVSNNQMLSQVDWQIDERLGELGPGGEWITADQFLIYETLDQGPLLLDTQGNVIQVAQEWFGVEELPSILDPSGVSLRAAGAAVVGIDDYHIALYGVGVEANFPAVRLYHSETGLVEEMPFRHIWAPGFSPEGQWLLLDELTVIDNAESHALWMRLVDPAGSQVRFFAPGERTAWSPDWTRAVLIQPDTVRLYAFPGGELLGTWRTGNYQPGAIAWSPDSNAVAVQASVPGEWQQALFLVQP